MAEKSPAKPAAKAKPKRLFMKQKTMNRVLYSLVPVLGASIYFFGWRIAALVAFTSIVGVATEWITSRRRGQSISMAVFVTSWLFALSLPPTTPFWISGVGVAVGILFGKEVFGGFGRNFANPAIVGRAFVYVTFPPELTASYVPVFQGFPGGLTHWSFRQMLEDLPHLPERLAAAGLDVAAAVSAATPMLARQRYNYITPLDQLAIGNIGGLFPAGAEDFRILDAGSAGEVSAVLIALGGIYLIWTKTANWRLTVGMLLGAIGANAIFMMMAGGFENLWGRLAYSGLDLLPSVPFTLLSGAMMYVAVYMVTDPVSAPKWMPAQWAYAVLVGVLVVLLRWKATFVGAAAFSLLLGNIFAPLLDIGAAWWHNRKRRPAAKAKLSEGG